ncbi:hypothetical protein V8C34DRAFT_285182 [Trichoderma compactum]
MLDHHLMHLELTLSSFHVPLLFSSFSSLTLTHSLSYTLLQLSLFRQNKTYTHRKSGQGNGSGKWGVAFAKLSQKNSWEKVGCLFSVLALFFFSFLSFLHRYRYTSTSKHFFFPLLFRFSYSSRKDFVCTLISHDTMASQNILAYFTLFVIFIVSFLLCLSGLLVLAACLVCTTDQPCRFFVYI